MGINKGSESQECTALAISNKTRRGGCPHPPGRAPRGDWRAKLARPDEGVRAYASRDAWEAN